MSDPFDVFDRPDDPVTPRPDFAADLRRRLEFLVGVPTLALTRTPTDPAPTDPAPTTRSPAMTNHVTPYLAVHDGPAALEFYTAAFGAVEVMRVVMDEETGRLGHAEFHIGGAVFYLSDEFPEIGVQSPRGLGGTAVTLHLTVDQVDDAFDAAVGAGATALAEPADQPHGARHGTLVDPFGHRWMLSQQIAQVPLDEYGERMREEGVVVTGTAERPGAEGGIWAALNYADARAGIRFMTDVLGFERQIVVPGDHPEVVEHSQLHWPEGGVVQAGSAGRPGNPFSERPTGAESLYVITADPMAVHRRCVAAGVEVVRAPESPEYDPGGLVFTIRDPEGNLWSFGNYAGEA
jgi:PhnB protein